MNINRNSRQACNRLFAKQPDMVETIGQFIYFVNQILEQNDLTFNWSQDTINIGQQYRRPFILRTFNFNDEITDCYLIISLYCHETGRYESAAYIS